jgi:hypothetical protein
MTADIAIFVVGLLFFVFRKTIGHQLFEMHKERGMPVKKEGYPLMMGGLGGAFMVIAATMFIFDRVLSK